MPAIESTKGRTSHHQPLLPGVVNIWRVSLSLSQETVARLGELLHPEELQKSKQFHFAKDQRRYIISRGALRTVLARYLNDLPERLTFQQGVNGKPFLAHPPAARNLHFNLSHCSDMALIAVAAARCLGVDVEKVRELPELELILERYFGTEEREFVESAQSEKRIKTFLTIWTRREATAKALGLDLSSALSHLDIPLYAPGKSTRLEHIENMVECSGVRKKGWFKHNTRNLSF